MSKVVLQPNYLNELERLNASINALNLSKIKVIFSALNITTTLTDFEKLMDWELILVTVRDRQMAVQLNKLVAYVPNLKFVVDEKQPLFALQQGEKKRRVWKER